MSIRIGTNWPAARSSAATVKPSLPGSMTSRTTTSNALPLLEQQLERLLAVARDVGLVPFGLEVEAKAVGDVLLVFDDEDACSSAGRTPGCLRHAAVRA